MLRHSSKQIAGAGDGDRERLITKGGSNWTDRNPCSSKLKQFVGDGGAVVLGRAMKAAFSQNKTADQRISVSPLSVTVRLTSRSRR